MKKRATGNDVEEELWPEAETRLYVICILLHVHSHGDEKTWKSIQICRSCLEETQKCRSNVVDMLTFSSYIPDATTGVDRTSRLHNNKNSKTHSQHKKSGNEHTRSGHYSDNQVRVEIRNDQCTIFVKNG